jgi:hypothetical protein
VKKKSRADPAGLNGAETSQKRGVNNAAHRKVSADYVVDVVGQEKAVHRIQVLGKRGLPLYQRIHDGTSAL